MEETRKSKTNETRKKNNFIMLPTVDFCFKELMQNPKIRQGIIAAILNVSPEEIKETELIPTVLRKEHKEDKFGILDVRVQLKDGTQIDIEMHMLELSKLPPEDKNEEGIILWMRFLGGKCEEDFKRMAEKDKYIGEAYEELKHISADEEKRREYEQREKNIRDYNSQMRSATRRGREIGFKRGLEEGMQEGIQEGKRKIILNMSDSGYPLAEIAKITDMTEENVKEILKSNDGKL